ncbi:hypothetical protein [Actinoplanes sp. N902-109]|nr:hypothetical protein [Actinoplanes sp. N902-109]AGL15785.1 hypothetical protein L083_2275 [Actinoplanes sp. N902-109]
MMRDRLPGVDFDDRAVWAYTDHTWRHRDAGLVLVGVSAPPGG